MKAVVINLDWHKERYEKIARMLSSMDIEFSRFSACTPDSMPERIRPFLFTATGKKRNPAMSAGEIGVYASHLEIMHLIVEKKLPSPLLVLEDDARFYPGSVKAIKSLYKNISSNPLFQEKDIDFINLYTKGFWVGIDSITFSGIRIIRNWIPSACFHAYLITRKGCEDFIAFRSRRIAPVDKDIKFAAWTQGMGVWEVTHALAYQDPALQSSISTGSRKKRFPRYKHERAFACHYYGRRYLPLYEIRRAIHKVRKRFGLIRNGV